VRIEQALLHGATKRGAMVESRPHVVVAGVTVGIDVHHPHGLCAADGAQDGQADRMIPADRQRDHAGLRHARIEGRNFGKRALKCKRLFQPAIAQIPNPGHSERRDTGCRIDPP
jgi:hypothetical protein